MGVLIEEHAKSDAPRYGFVVCDNSEAWLMNSAGNVWAAEKLVDGYRSVARNGLSVGQKIDKQCDKLQDKTKELGLWDGSVSEAMKTADFLEVKFP
jgi:dipeptidase